MEFGLSILDKPTIRELSLAVQRFDLLSGTGNLANGNLLSTLRSVQFPEAPHVDTVPFEITFVSLGQAADHDDPSVRLLLRYEPIDDLACTPEPNIGAFSARCSDALGLLREMYPQTFDTFSLFMRRIVITDGASAGGSSSEAIGLLWLSPEPNWSSVTFAEHILHECVHSALFLTHMVKRVFSRPPGDMDSVSERVLSAIRQTVRRYDLAFHSALVAYVLSRFQYQIGCLPRAQEYLVPLAACLEGLAAKPQNLTDYGRGLLAEIAELSAMNARNLLRA